MKSKLIIPLYLLAAALCLASCSKNVLDKQPLDSYTDASVWNDLQLSEAFANNLYNVLPSAAHNWDNTTNRSWALSSACDEAFNKFNDYNAVIMNSGALTPDNAGIFDTWAPLYSIIQNCNLFLSKIDKVPGDSAWRNRLKGEVTFLRAFGYFRLISDYGGVPLVTAALDLNSDFKYTRSTYDQCVDFITGEADKAAALLPLSYSGGSYGRVTKAAAMALKSRALLYAASPQWNTSNDPAKW